MSQELKIYVDPEAGFFSAEENSLASRVLKNAVADA
jgi:hypothetical protein